MHSLMRISSTVVAAWSMVACSMLGPEAKVTMAEGELSATKSVGNIVIASPTGVPDGDHKLDKIFSGTAVKAFGSRGRPSTAVNTALKAAGAPEGLPDALLAPYLAKFDEALKDYDPKKEKSRPTAMSLPPAESDALKMPKKLDAKALKGVMAKLKGEAGTLKEVGGAMGKGDLSGAAASLGKSPVLSPLLTQATLSLMSKLNADHLLLTRVVGDEATYNKGGEVRIVSALVNIKTGKFRFFGEIAGKKEMGMPYFLYLANMSSKVLEKGAEDDPAMAEEVKGDGKKGKKKSDA